VSSAMHMRDDLLETDNTSSAAQGQRRIHWTSLPSDGRGVELTVCWGRVDDLVRRTLCRCVVEVRFGRLAMLSLFVEMAGDGGAECGGAVADSAPCPTP
jgi:hypothetical protein